MAALDNGYAQPWVGLGHIDHARNRPAEAVQAFRQATQRDKTLAPAWFGLGAAYQALGQNDQAIKLGVGVISIVGSGVEAGSMMGVSSGE